MQKERNELHGAVVKGKKIVGTQKRAAGRYDSAIKESRRLKRGGSTRGKRKRKLEISPGREETSFGDSVSFSERKRGKRKKNSK